MVTDQVVARARIGDDDAFRALVQPYQRELTVHCYRMLGSVQDAEDVLQETLLAAWRGLGDFQGHASLRTWLYRIATNRCLNALRDGQRRPQRELPTLPFEPPPATRTVEPMWLQPIPDSMLDGLPDTAPGPEARYESAEAISLAFVTAVQSLPPRQRAVLLLRDVLGFRAAEVARMLSTTEESVTSALKRARATLADPPPPAARPDSPAERRLVDAFVAAMERGDTEAMVALLTDDAWLTMPPVSLEYQGRAAIADFLWQVAFRQGRRRYRLVPTGRANGQPAFGCYTSDGDDPVGHAHGLMVLTLGGGQIAALTRFIDNSLLPYFGLARSI